MSANSKRVTQPTASGGNAMPADRVALVELCAQIAEAMNESAPKLTYESTRADTQFVEGYEEACADITRTLRTLSMAEAEGNERLGRCISVLAALLAGPTVPQG